MAVKGSAIDVWDSVEAGTKTNSEWKSFVLSYDSTYEQRFRNQIVKMREKLDVYLYPKIYTSFIIQLVTSYYCAFIRSR